MSATFGVYFGQDQEERYKQLRLKCQGGRNLPGFVRQGYEETVWQWPPAEPQSYLFAWQAIGPDYAMR